MHANKITKKHSKWKKHYSILSHFSSLATLLLLSSCSEPVNTKCIPNEDTLTGGYKGVFSILGGAYTFDDSLTITNPIADDRKIS